MLFYINSNERAVTERRLRAHLQMHTQPEVESEVVGWIREAKCRDTFIRDDLMIRAVSTICHQLDIWEDDLIKELSESEKAAYRITKQTMHEHITNVIAGTPEATGGKVSCERMAYITELALKYVATYMEDARIMPKNACDM